MGNKTRADDDEAVVLVDEDHSKSLTGPTRPNSVRRFAAFVIVLFIILAIIIVNAPPSQQEESDQDDKSVGKVRTTKSPTIVAEFNEEDVVIPGPSPASTGSPTPKIKGGGGGGGHKQKTTSPSLKETVDSNAEDEVLKQTQEDLEESELDDGDDSEENKEISSNESGDVEDVKDFLDDDSEEVLSDEERDSQTAMSGEGVAPRTSTEPYNYINPDEKYMIYNPSGGMSNQELELVNALKMAQVIGRKLYVPMVGRHSNLPIGYNKLKLDELFPADRVYDFEMMNSFTDVLAINMTLKKFISYFAKVNGEHNIRLIVTSFGYNGMAASKSIKQMNHKLVMFSGRAMWGRWWSSSERQKTRRFLAYSPQLRSISIKVARAAMGDRFYAIHGRLGDETYRWGGADSGDAFVNTPQYRLWDKRLPIYLASDDPNNAFFKPLKAHAKMVITAHDLHGPEVDTFRALFPSRNVRNDMFGVLDKLICSLALEFMGSSFSTFSLEIRMVRGQAKYVFPEGYAFKHNLTSAKP